MSAIGTEPEAVKLAVIQVFGEVRRMKVFVFGALVLLLVEPARDPAQRVWLSASLSFAVTHGKKPKVNGAD